MSGRKTVAAVLTEHGIEPTSHLSARSREELAVIARRQELAGERRLFRKALGQVIRENMPPEEIFVWLRSVAAGKDPDGDGSGHMPIDWSIRAKAFQMLLERAYGLPAQHVTVEAEMRAQLSVATVHASVDDWRKLPQDQLKQFRDTLKQLVKPAVNRAIDTTGTEAPAEYPDRDE
jgi:hypothetical protein